MVLCGMLLAVVFFCFIIITYLHIVIPLVLHLHHFELFLMLCFLFSIYLNFCLLGMIQLIYVFGDKNYLIQLLLDIEKPLINSKLKMPFELIYITQDAIYT